MARAKDMATQAWQPQSAQPPVPGQSPMSGSQGNWVPSVTTPVQGHGITQSPYPVSSSFPPSPSSAGHAYRGPSQSSSESLSAQPPQPTTTPSSAGLVQASYSIPSHTSGQGVPGHAPPSTPYPGPRWQPPSVSVTQTGPSGSSVPGGSSGLANPSGTPGFSVPSLPPGLPSASQGHSVSTTGLSGISAPSVPPGMGPPGPSVPSGLPGSTLPPMPPGPPGLSLPPVPSGPTGHSASSAVSGLPGPTGINGPPVPPGSGPSVSAGPPGSTAPPLPPGPPGLSLPPMPPGPPGLPVSQGPAMLSGLPVTPGPPGLSGNTGPPGASGSAGLPGPSGQSGFSMSPAPPGILPTGPPGLIGHSGPSGSVGPSTAVGISVAPGPPGIPASNSAPAPLGPQMPADTSVMGPRPAVSTSTIPASTVAPAAGSATAPVMQQPQYIPYVSTPSITPQMPPWMLQSQVGGHLQPRPFPAYTFTNMYTVQIRPVVPPQAGATGTSKATSNSTSPLAPPGEQAPLQVTSSKASNDWGSKLLPVSSTSSGQMMNVSAASSGGAAALTSTMQSKLLGSSVTGMDKSSAIDSGSKAEIPVKDEVVDAWTAHKTSEGAVYYYNSVTGQSTYEKPLGFQGEADKVTSQPVPVSWEMIGGTGWALVTTNDAKRYYYNIVTRATSWQVPGEVAEYRKKQVEEVSTKVSMGSGQTVTSIAEKGTISFSLNIPGAVTWGREAHKSIVPTGSSSALDLIKKKLQDSATPGLGTLASNLAGSPIVDGADAVDSSSNRGPSMEANREKVKESTAERSSSESSSDSDDEDRGPTKDECVLQFKEMLKEKGVVPFSKWEKELPKIIFDARFKAIPSHTERRSIFDHYVRTRAEEERKEKRAAQKAAVEAFKHLLEQASQEIDHTTTYESFAKDWGSDPRFDKLEQKDRETLLNERVLPLRKAEEERIRAIHLAAVSGFKAMLKEKGEVTTSSRWSRVKDALRNDPRYRSVKREDRETLFNSYVSELRAAEQEAERSAKAKREEEEKLKEREREMRKRKEREEQEIERARAKNRRRDAVNAYQALLTEKIKDPEASWTEARVKLEKDTLGRATNPELDIVDRERLFREHVTVLYERCVREYRSLLADTITTDVAAKPNEDGKNIWNSWSEAKKVLKSDPRYSKMPRRDRETLWHRYTEDMQRRLKLPSATSSKDERHPASESGKAVATDSNRHSPGPRRNSSRR